MHSRDCVQNNGTWLNYQQEQSDASAAEQSLPVDAHLKTKQKPERRITMNFVQANTAENGQLMHS